MARLIHPPDALAAALGSLPRRWFCKAELIAELTARGVADAERSFVRLREAARRGVPCDGCKVHSMGQGRGVHYAFGPRRPALPRHLSASPSGLRDFPAPRAPATAGRIEVIHGDNLEVLPQFADGSFDLIYIDPPFNTGRKQARTRLKTERAEDGERVGFHGQRYRETVVGVSSFRDSFDDYLGFLWPRLEQAHRLLSPHGSFFLHLDCREVHYAKVALDQLFGRDAFLNEIIWAYDYGARSTSRWPAKHDNILWYAKDPANYCFDYAAIDRIPYMAPGLVGAEKAARGKTPTDTWWNTIVSPNGKEKTGYPTQKPLAILQRIVRVHSRPGDRLLDFFAGSGSFGEAGASLGREITLIDESAEAIEVMRRRFANYPLSVRSNEPDTSRGASARRKPVRTDRRCR